MKILKRIISFFTNDWWLKLIALLLAIIIYHSEKSGSNDTHQTTNDRTLLQFK